MTLNVVQERSLHNRCFVLQAYPFTAVGVLSHARRKGQTGCLPRAVEAKIVEREKSS